MFAGKSYFQRIAHIHGLGKTQIVYTVVRKYGTEVRVDEKPCRERDDQIAVCGSTVEERIFLRKFLTHMRVEGIAREVCKVFDICKQKTLREGAGYGEVRWDTEVTNQKDELVASYDVLTMVATSEEWASINS